MASEKDRWDKFATLSSFLSSFLLAAIGLTFTFVNAHQEAANRAVEQASSQQIEKVQTLEKFLPHLAGSEGEKRAALAAIKALGYPQLATELATSNQGPGAVQFLQTVASTETGRGASAAVDALKRISHSQQHAPPNFSTTPAEALRSVMEASSDPTVKVEAARAVSDLFERARKSTVSVGSEAYASGFLVGPHTIITTDVVPSLAARMNTTIPLFARMDDGGISPTTTLISNQEFHVIALKISRNSMLPALTPFALASTIPPVGSRVWVMTTKPNSQFSSVGGTIVSVNGTKIRCSFGSVSVADGVFAGAPVVNEQNELVAMLDSGSSCMSVASLKPFFDEALKATSTP